MTARAGAFLSCSSPPRSRALSACASDELARHAAVQVWAVRARPDRASGVGQANAGESAVMEARVRTLEAQVARGDRERWRSEREIERLRTEIVRLESMSRAASPGAAAPHARTLLARRGAARAAR